MAKCSYAYNLPEELIARRPAEPRDASRLFVYDTRSNEVQFDRFYNLDKYLPEDGLLVLNNTKVVPARAGLYKETGGKVEALFLLNEWSGKGAIPVLLNKGVAVGAKVFFGEDRCFTVAGHDKNVFYLEPAFDADEIFALLDEKGVTPIPKYIKGADLSEVELREKYQTVFGEKPSSVAAPTASLHFTPRVFEAIEKKGVGKAFVTLHVGMGTFAPVTEENFLSRRLHREFYEVPEASAGVIRKSKREGKAIIAAGTTTMRTLESAAERILKGEADAGATDIFIMLPHEFKVADMMITNFHLPETSLMMLVQAFLEFKGAESSLAELYEEAIKEKFRFYSFGDAMLIS